MLHSIHSNRKKLKINKKILLTRRVKILLAVYSVKDFKTINTFVLQLGYI